MAGLAVVGPGTPGKRPRCTHQLTFTDLDSPAIQLTATEGDLDLRLLRFLREITSAPITLVPRQVRDDRAVDIASHESVSESVERAVLRTMLELSAVPEPEPPPAAAPKPWWKRLFLPLVLLALPLQAQVQQPRGTIKVDLSETGANATPIVVTCAGCSVGGTITANQGSAAAQSARWPMFLSTGTVERIGQAMMAASLPVVIASDQTVAVSAAALPLPSGASTEATLALIKAKTDNLDVALSTRTKPADSQTVTGTVAATQSGTWTVQPGNTANTTAWKVDGSAVTQPVSGTFWQATQPISAASLPLPALAATSTLQGTGNTSLSSIDGKITAVNTGAVVVSSSALPSGAATGTKQDTGNTSLASIDGKITAVNTGAVVVSSSALPALAATSTKQSDGSQKTQVVDGSGNVIGATSNALDINIKSGNPTTITATQGTGTNLHTVVDSGSITATQGTGTNLHTVVDSGTITVSGTATVSQGTGTNLHTVLDSGTLTTVTTLTGITNALPSGTNVIGHVITDATSLGAVDVAFGATTDPTYLRAIAGKTNDRTPAYVPLPVSAGGQAMLVQVINQGGGLLPPCNPVRRMNCYNPSR